MAGHLLIISVTSRSSEERWARVGTLHEIRLNIYWQSVLLLHVPQKRGELELGLYIKFDWTFTDNLCCTSEERWARVGTSHEIRLNIYWQSVLYLGREVS